MSSDTHDLDLGSMRLAPGEGRRLELTVPIAPLMLGGERYGASPDRVPVTLDISRIVGGGYALRLRMEAAIVGPCMRCLNEAGPTIEVDAREVDLPGSSLGEGAEDESDDVKSPYVEHGVLDLAAWAHDAFALAAPVQVLCREDCRGLCPICAVDLNAAGPEHVHESEPDPRWAKLRELHFD